jgi:branched-chain amino acid transport system ATP-binding protein
MSFEMDGLTVTNLRVRYGEAIALQDVCLHVAAGSRVAIIGRNGAGKSTLLNAIAGIVPARSGAVTFDGDDITDWPPHRRVRAGISLVPEGRRTFRALSVAQNLKVGAFASRRDFGERLGEVTSLFPVLRDRHRYAASQLSGGESQMLAIAQALMAKPKLLLLDEPSLGLAPVAVRRVLAAVEELSASGLGVVLVEQSVRLAVEFADETYALVDGRLVEVARRGTTADADAIRAAYFGGAPV